MHNTRLCPTDKDSLLQYNIQQRATARARPSEDLHPASSANLSSRRLPPNSSLNLVPQRIQSTARICRCLTGGCCTEQLPLLSIRTTQASVPCTKTLSSREMSSKGPLDSFLHIQKRSTKADHYANPISSFRFWSCCKKQSRSSKSKQASCAKSDAEMVLDPFACLLV